MAEQIIEVLVIWMYDENLDFQSEQLESSRLRTPSLSMASSPVLHLLSATIYQLPFLTQLHIPLIFN